MAEQLIITTPAGRLVQGSLYDPQTKDMDGAPLVVKNGPDKGKPTQRFYFALAIPKEPGHAHWAHTIWGAKLWALGHTSFPVAAQRSDFAWKIEDGDSTIPNKKNRKPCDSEGFKGCWVLRFSSGFAPKIYSLVGQPPGTDPAPLVQKDAINLGDFAQVNFSAASNGQANNPGIYLNHSMVCLIGYGQRIVLGPDVGQAGFGVAALPAGATLMPPAGFVPPVVAAPGVTTAAPPPVVTTAAPPPVVAATAGGAPPPPVVVAPHTAILTPTPPVPAGPRMTAKAGTIPYEQFITQGWTDVMLKQHGYME